MNKSSILHIVTWLDVGGLEILVRDLAQYQKTQGNSVYIGCLGGQKGILSQEFERLGIPVYPTIKFKNRSNLIAFTCSIKKIFVKAKPNVIHIHVDGLLALIPIIIAKFLGIKFYVRSIHNSMPAKQWGWKKRLWRKIEISLSVFLGVQLVAVSDDVRFNEINAFKIKPSWIKVVPNGVNISSFTSLDGKNLPLETLIGKQVDREKVFLMLCVARFNPQKNHELLLKAVAELVKRNCLLEPHLLLAGKGELESKLRRLAEELKITEYVHFLGLRRDIPKLLCASDIFCLSSLFEGLPISAIEAMAAGKPVIATRVSGLEGVISDGQNGILVELNNVKQYANAMEKLMTNVQMRDGMGRTAQKNAVDTYSLQTCAEKYESLYRGHN